MNIHTWAANWGISAPALDELLQSLGAMSPDPALKSGESEAAVQTRVRLDASKSGGRLWRNNVGACETTTGSYIRYGLANESTAINKKCKSSDLIGIKPIVIEPRHVGSVIGQFVAREVKHGAWKYAATGREVAQLNFLNLVNAMGGDAKFTTGDY